MVKREGRMSSNNRDGPFKDFSTSVVIINGVQRTLTRFGNLMYFRPIKK